ncbi:MAG TPA: hypothetical protein VJ901_10540 [Thermoanaerobaculia bacterium]|nr:hypothetical protein [Thermoanaerobaculia bacterium]
MSRALSHTVVVLDAASGNVLSTLPSGNFGIAVNEANNLVAVCERGQTIDGDPPAPGRLHILRDGSSAPLQVTIELHPSVIQLGSKGVVSATILSTPSFDATTIVPSSVRLGAAPAIRSHIDDANADGRADLVIQAERQQLQNGARASCPHVSGVSPGTRAESPRETRSDCGRDVRAPRATDNYTSDTELVLTGSTAAGRSITGRAAVITRK